MVHSDSLAQYATLLHIRQHAGRRDVLISGGVFLIAVLATIALGLLDRIEGRSIYLLSGILIAFATGYLRIWVRLEIANNTLELIDHMQRGMTANQREEQR